MALLAVAHFLFDDFGEFFDFGGFVDYGQGELIFAALVDGVFELFGEVEEMLGIVDDFFLAEGVTLFAHVLEHAGLLGVVGIGCVAEAGCVGASGGGDARRLHGLGRCLLAVGGGAGKGTGGEGDRKQVGAPGEHGDVGHDVFSAGLEGNLALIFRVAAL
jgi:hypothetical protein